MKFYILGLSYAKALEAVKLIKQWAKENEVSEEVDANIGTGGVHVTTKTELQVHKLNVILDDNNLGNIGNEAPFFLKEDGDKKAMLNDHGIS